MTSTENSIIDEEIETRDIFLTSDERYDVWSVKSAERPHLLQYSTTIESSSPEDGNDKSSDVKQTSSGDDHESDSDDDTTGSIPLPLLDGCDLPGWRKEGLVLPSAPDQSNHYQQGLLNVGLGCSLLRRESQVGACLPDKFLADTPWKRLQAKLLEEPPSVPGTAKGGPSEAASVVNGRVAAIRLSPSETEQLTGPYPWFEKQNVPVILEGCTANWKAMETCTWQSLLETYGDYQWRFSDTHGACMSLDTYTKYTKSIEGLTDDAPLAVYDSQFHLDERVHLLQEYHVPPCFDGMDLFQDVMVDESDEDGDEDNRDKEVDTENGSSLAKSEGHDQSADVVPQSEDDNSHNDSDEDSHSSSSTPNPPPYRWILMGPARSGTYRFKSCALPLYPLAFSVLIFKCCHIPRNWFAH